MSRENVEVVQEGLRLWGLNPDGGLAPIDLDRLQEVFEGDTTAAAELFDPEVELHPPEGEVGGSLQRGYRGIVQNWRDLLFLHWPVPVEVDHPIPFAPQPRGWNIDPPQFVVSDTLFPGRHHLPHRAFDVGHRTLGHHVGGEGVEPLRILPAGPPALA